MYIDRFGLPSILSNADSLTISGASNPGSNGTFSEAVGAVFYPTFGGQYFGGADEGSWMSWMIDGQTFANSSHLAVETSGVNIGDLIDPSHFGLTAVSGASFQNSSDGSTYLVSAFVGQVVVPAPGALALLGMAGLARRRRRA